MKLIKILEIIPNEDGTAKYNRVYLNPQHITLVTPTQSNRYTKVGWIPNGLTNSLITDEPIVDLVERINKALK